MPKQALDFTKVEALRKHMLLTVGDMSRLFGVSRQTYYSWLDGGKLRHTSDDRVRRVLRRLLTIMTEHKWPTPDVIAADQRDRVKRLDALLENME